MPASYRTFLTVFALIGVISCFFVHLPCGPFTATNGPGARASDLRLDPLDVTDGLLIAHVNIEPNRDSVHVAADRHGAWTSGHSRFAAPLRC